MGAEIFQLAMLQSNALERIDVLAREYLAKTITAERFSARVCDELRDYDKMSKELLSEIKP